MGTVGLNWTIAGFGDFSGTANETDMLLRDNSTGAFEVYDISHNAITSAASMGAVGLNWQVAGFGSFEDAIDVSCRLPILLERGDGDAVGHQTANPGELGVP